MRECMRECVAYKQVTFLFDFRLGVFLPAFILTATRATRKKDFLFIKKLMHYFSLCAPAPHTRTRAHRRIHTRTCSHIQIQVRHQWRAGQAVKHTCIHFQTTRSGITDFRDCLNNAILLYFSLAPGDTASNSISMQNVLIYIFVSICVSVVMRECIA